MCTKELLIQLHLLILEYTLKIIADENLEAQFMSYSLVMEFTNKSYL